MVNHWNYSFNYCNCDFISWLTLNRQRNFSRSYKMKKLFSNWEYWPMFMFYIPNLPYGLYLALKSKNKVFFSGVNPIIKSSGNGTESKYDTIQLIPEKYRPKTILATPEQGFNEVINNLNNQKIQFPLIAKPDVGFRGLLVKKIKSKEELKKYLSNYPIKIIIQEFISYPHECGLFYHRFPNQDKGNITSITLKRFLSVKGNGISTISQLILKDKRAKKYYKLLKDIHQDTLNSILKNKEVFLLNDIGNHAKGTQFINGNHLINNNLIHSIDKLNKQIEGWYYGRLDIKYDSFEAMTRGKGFKILEINGVLAEPTHIYDSTKLNYWQALKIIRKHWKIMFEIGKENHLLKQGNFTTPRGFIKEVRELKDYTKKIKQLSM